MVRTWWFYCDGLGFNLRSCKPHSVAKIVQLNFKKSPGNFLTKINCTLGGYIIIPFFFFFYWKLLTQLLMCIIRFWMPFLFLRGTWACRNGLSSHWPRWKYKSRNKPCFTSIEPGTSSQRHVFPTEHRLDLPSPRSVKQKTVIYKYLLITTPFFFFTFLFVAKFRSLYI